MEHKRACEIQDEILSIKFFDQYLRMYPQVYGYSVMADEAVDYPRREARWYCNRSEPDVC